MVLVSARGHGPRRRGRLLCRHRVNSLLGEPPLEGGAVALLPLPQGVSHGTRSSLKEVGISCGERLGQDRLDKFSEGVWCVYGMYACPCLRTGESKQDQGCGITRHGTCSYHWKCGMNTTMLLKGSLSVTKDGLGYDYFGLCTCTWCVLFRGPVDPKVFACLLHIRDFS